MASAFTCPECGAEPVVHPGERLVTCAACKTQAAVVGVEGVPQRLVEPTIDAAAAAQAARGWLRGLRVRELVTARATISAPILAWLPFVRVEADVLGWLFGTKKHEDRQGKVTFTNEEIEIAESHDEALPLCDPGETGVHRLPKLAGVATVPFDEAAVARRGDVVPALTTEETIEDRVRAQWLDRAQRGHELHSVTDTELALVGVQQTIVYYPFWRVAYRYDGSDFVVMVDARTGEIAAGKAPGSFFVSALGFAALVPTASVILAAGLALAAVIFYAGMAASDVSDSLAGFIMGVAIAVGGGAIAIGVALTTAGHRSMRFGGEIEGGYGVRPDAGLFDDESASAYRKRRAAERALVDADERLQL